jgi:hypothetical protein
MFNGPQQPRLCGGATTGYGAPGITLSIRSNNLTTATCATNRVRHPGLDLILHMLNFVACGAIYKGLRKDLCPGISGELHI